MPERFSVLLPVWGGDSAEFVTAAIRSVTAEQTLRPAELVVVRDGPVDADVEAVLGALLGEGSAAGGVPVTIVTLRRNVGLARALTAGLAACTHELIARADADDLSVPTRFEVQIPLMTERGLDLLGSAVTEFTDDPATPGMTRRLPTEPDQIARMARFRDPFNHPSVVYRRAAVYRAGGYTHLDLMEDYWLFVRMIRTGAKVANVADSLVMYRVGAGAYARRGGLRLLRSELALQRRMREADVTTRAQAVRNVVLRGGYRLVPQALRRVTYRRMVRRPAESRPDS